MTQLVLNNTNISVPGNLTISIGQNITLNASTLIVGGYLEISSGPNPSLLSSILLLHIRLSRSSICPSPSSSFRLPPSSFVLLNHLVVLLPLSPHHLRSIGTLSLNNAMNTTSIVNGGLSIDPDGRLAIVLNGTGNAPFITVSGCVQLNGSVRIF